MKLIRLALTADEAAAVYAMLKFYREKIENDLRQESLPALYSTCERIMRKIERQA